MSLHTARSYWRWCVQFIKFHKIKDETTLCENRDEMVTAFLTAEARRGISASTQNQAFCALLFLFNDVLDCPLGDISAIRVTRPRRLPEMITHEDAVEIIDQLEGDYQLIAQLMYGAGLRVSEALRLRIKDVDTARNLIAIHSGKGDKDRLVPLPPSLKRALQSRIESRQLLHEADLKAGFGWVWMPNLLRVKYPAEQKSLRWQYIFRAANRSKDPETGNIGRHHISPQAVQKAMSKAVGEKKITPHNLRHAYVCSMEDKGVPLTVISKLVGHEHLETTLRYSQFNKRGIAGLPNPLD